METLTSRWDTLPRRRVRVVTAGVRRDGVPELAIVPGLGALGYLLPTVRACSSWTRVHLLDVPGFGRRETAGCPASLASVADTVTAWLRASGTGPIALMGHSTGAQAALRAAAQAPGRVDCLILAGPSFAPDSRRLAPLARRIARTLPYESSGEIAATLPEYLRGRTGVVTLLRTAMDDDPEALVPLIAARIVVLRGRHDAVSDAGWAAQLAEGARHGWLITLPGAHNFCFTHPRATSSVLRAVLRPAHRRR